MLPACSLSTDIAIWPDTPRLLRDRKDCWNMFIVEMVRRRKNCLRRRMSLRARTWPVRTSIGYCAWGLQREKRWDHEESFWAQSTRTEMASAGAETDLKRPRQDCHCKSSWMSHTFERPNLDIEDPFLDPSFVHKCHGDAPWHHAICLA